MTAADWLYARIALRFPNLHIVLSEGGLGWVRGFLDRLDHAARYQGFTDTSKGLDRPVSELFLDSVHFCAIEDPTTFTVLDRIGDDRVMVEVDYPRIESTRPNVQSVLRTQLQGLSDSAVRRVTHENASALFRHPITPGD